MSAPTLRLRKAGLADVGAVRDILTAAASDLTTRFGHGHWSNVRAVETLQKYASNGTLHIVEADAGPVATLRLTDRKIGFYKKGWFARPQDPAGYLLDMAVHSDHQRRGIGRQAMELAERLARRDGLLAVRLDAYKGHAGAGKFYEKCGYRLVHESAMRGVALQYFEKLLLPVA